MTFAVPTGTILNCGSSGSGGDSPEVELSLNFAFGDASPSPIGTILANRQVISIQIFIVEAFNGLGAQLQIGTLGTPADLMSASENNPAAIGEYSVYSQKSYGSDTPIVLTITPGSGVSTGSGFLIVKYQP